MADKNDLSAYKKDNKQTLNTPVTKPKKGRGEAKPKPEKRTHKVLLSLTEKEGAIVKEKAGLVPVATYLMSLLRKQGVLD